MTLRTLATALLFGLSLGVAGCGSETREIGERSNEALVHYQVIEEDGNVSILGSRELVGIEFTPTPGPTDVTISPAPPPVPLQVVTRGSFDLLRHDLDGDIEEWDVVNLRIMTRSLRLTADSGSFVISQDPMSPLMATIFATINGRAVVLTGEGGPHAFSNASPPRFRGLLLGGDGVYLVLLADPVR